MRRNWETEYHRRRDLTVKWRHHDEGIKSSAKVTNRAERYAVRRMLRRIRDRERK